jgi:hypothetical protein
MGATLVTPFARLGEWPSSLNALREAGFTLVALTPREPSEAIDAFVARPRPPRCALIVGAEGVGLTPAVESMANHRVRIPIALRSIRSISPSRLGSHFIVWASVGSVRWCTLWKHAPSKRRASYPLIVCPASRRIRGAPLAAVNSGNPSNPRNRN